MVMELLKQSRAEGRLRPVDVALADWCARHGGSPRVAVAMALGSQAAGEGHSCLLLDETFQPIIPRERAFLETPFCSRDELMAALSGSKLVGGPGDSRPLVLEGERLYLQRYWQYEQQLASRLKAMLNHHPAEVTLAPLHPEGGLFDYRWVGEDQTHWQAVAAAVALRHRFCVISGGPGTGKTYTVLRLMQLLIEDARQRNRRPPEIRLAAPTGKAAARMMESTRQGLAGLPDSDALAEQLPESASTLHRLLGLRGDSTRPLHKQDNPLVADVVIVDEASMVDLPLMAKLADAIPDHGRLILLGDRYQLASVESGAVLAELCHAAGLNRFSRDQQQALAPLLRDDAPAAADPPAPLSDQVVTLQTSHRFTADSPIGRLAAAVNAGEADTALAIASEDQNDIRLHTDTPRQLDGLVNDMATAYSPLITAEDPELALNALDRLRLLTATRVGPTGSMALNEAIHRRLAEQHDFDADRRWYHGRPVIVLHNDYRVELFNGDTGICLPDENGLPRVWFRTSTGLRALLPTDLPRHESVYAMTVHKSQGSEFDHVHLLLPEQDMPVLTRELIYTGITRAREALTLHGNEAALRAAIGRSTRRHSGLAARLK